MKWKTSIELLSSAIRFSRKPTFTFGLQSTATEFPVGFYGFDNDGSVHQDGQIYPKTSSTICSGDDLILVYDPIAMTLKMFLQTKRKWIAKTNSITAVKQGNYVLHFNMNGKGTKLKMLYSTPDIRLDLLSTLPLFKYDITPTNYDPANSVNYVKKYENNSGSGDNKGQT